MSCYKNYNYHILVYYSPLHTYKGTVVAQWLWCCATIRKVFVSMPTGVSGLSLTVSPSNRTMALGSTEPLIQKGTRGFS